MQSKLESRLADLAQRPLDVFFRSSLELQELLRGNPFPHADPKRTYSNYPLGTGQSKLVIPAAKNSTARKMNTIARLVAMSS